MSASRSVARVRQRRPMLFAAALLTLVAAFFGPVDHYADELFWVHMVQHVLLLMVAAPLLVLAAPWMSLLRLLPVRTVRAVGRWWRQLRGPAITLTTPIVVWIAFNANLVAWHVPVLFNLTLEHTDVHVLEHLLFLVTSALFWAQVIDAPLLRKRMDNLARVLYITSAAVVSWLLSIALALAPSALYSGYASALDRPGRFSALADQRIAASVMLVPASITFLIAGLVYAHRWLDDESREATPATRTRIVRSQQEQPA